MTADHLALADPRGAGDGATGLVSARALTEDSIRAALGAAPFPAATTNDSGRFLGDAVQHVSVCGARVRVVLALQVSAASELADIESTVVSRVHALAPCDVEVVIRRPEHSRAPRLRSAGDPWAGQVRLARVRHVIAVGAGKGGVGKSTVAVNLALALARNGLRVGLLDADIYGPSLPILLGIEDGNSRVRMTPDKHIVPLEAHGLALVSFGFFLGEQSPAIWRGPMVARAVTQFARGVAWPDLDLLIVDLPPGTGDVPLSLAQAIELSGAIVVTQPARVATVEARKAWRMFASVDVPVLGMVENMTGAFGTGVGAAVCADLDVPFLGALPFDPDVVRDGDAGTPTMIARADGATGRIFTQIAERVAERLGWRPAEGRPR